MRVCLFINLGTLQCRTFHVEMVPDEDLELTVVALSGDAWHHKRHFRSVGGCIRRDLRNHEDIKMTVGYC